MLPPPLQTLCLHECSLKQHLLSGHDVTSHETRLGLKSADGPFKSAFCKLLLRHRILARTCKPMVKGGEGPETCEFVRLEQDYHASFRVGANQSQLPRSVYLEKEVLPSGF